jgi:hypothetical protein
MSVGCSRIGPLAKFSNEHHCKRINAKNDGVKATDEWQITRAASV